MIRTVNDVECLDEMTQCFPECPDIVESYAFGSCRGCNETFYGPTLIHCMAVPTHGVSSLTALDYPHVGLRYVPTLPALDDSFCGPCLIKEQIRAFGETTTMMFTHPRASFRFAFFGQMKGEFDAPLYCYDRDDMWTRTSEYTSRNGGLRIIEYEYPE